MSFFGLVLFPGKSYAAVASWDFNTPLAYNYDTTKIQITDGTAIFKASQVVTPTVEPAPATETVPASEPVSTEPVPTTEPIPATEPVTEPVSEPVVEPAPAPVVEPAPAPVVEPAPGPLLFDNLRQLFKTQVGLKKEMGG